eukprot:4246675-Prymnesium_polylepis.1
MYSALKTHATRVAGTDGLPSVAVAQRHSGRSPRRGCGMWRSAASSRPIHRPAPVAESRRGRRGGSR